MKKLFIALFVLFLVAGTALTIVGFVKGEKIDRDAQWFSEEKEFTAVNEIPYDIKTVTIDADYANITVLPLGDMAASYSYFVQYEAMDRITEYSFSCDETSGLRIQQRLKNNWSWITPRTPKITVYVPAAVKTINTVGEASNMTIQGGSYDTLSVDTAAGNVNFTSNLTIANGCTIKSTAGNIEIDSSKIGGDMRVSSTAGNIRVMHSTVYDSLDISSTAGNIKIEESKIAALKISSTAGNLKINDSDIKTMDSDIKAGNIKIAGGNVNGTIRSYTGNCDIYNASYAVNYYLGGELREQHNAESAAKYGTLDVRLSMGTFEFN